MDHLSWDDLVARRRSGSGAGRLFLEMVMPSIVLVLALLSCGDPQPNILVIVLDDVGVDKIDVYNEHPDAGPTPVVDLLAEYGALYRNAWAFPICSPTRASVLTGRYPFRHGIGTGSNNGTFAIDDEEVTLPEALSAEGYRTAAIGKWHLAPATWSTEDIAQHPIVFGFDRFLGISFNIEDYYSWPRVVAEEGVEPIIATSTTYATTQQVDDALDVIEDFGSDPWFVWLAFSAPHMPLHEPPSSLHTGGDLSSASSEDIYSAMLEAVDTEIGRLLAGIRPAAMARTYVIVLGDNGTYAEANTTPFGGIGKNKGDVTEGGVNVPLVILGPDVTPGPRTTLTSVIDVFATVVELAGGSPSADDSVSLVATFDKDASIRSTVFSARHGPNGHAPTNRQRAIRDVRYKLIRRDGNYPSALKAVEAFDLLLDPFETSSLLTAGGAPLPGTSMQAAAAIAALDVILSTLE